MTAAGTPAAIRATGLRKSYGKQVVLDGIDLEVAEGTVYALLGPNGAGKTTTVHILSTLIAADGGEVEVAGHDVAREPDAVRAADRRHRPVLGGRRALQRRGEPAAHRGSAASRQGRGPAASRGAARAVRPGRRREEACRDLLRGHATTARPRDDAGRRPADHLPRRADGGTRSPQPPGRCGRRSAISSRTASRSC